MQAIQPWAHRAASIHCRVWIRKQTALYDPSAFNPLRILRWYFVIGRARCAVELGIGILRQKLFDPFFFFFFLIYITAFTKVKTNLSILFPRQSRSKRANRFIFEKFGDAVSQREHFEREWGWREKSDERDVSFPESVGLGINYASWKFRQIS